LIEDPNQKNWVSGADGQVGATFYWEGVAVKSKGAQKITALVENEHVTMQCDITAPFVARPTFEYSITEQNGEIVVTQNFSTDLGVPGNVFGMLFGLKKQMAATNELGLQMLKKSIEQPTGITQH
jgi:hypothetical protein